MINTRRFYLPIILFLLLLILFVAVFIFLDFNKGGVSKEVKDNSCVIRAEKTVQGDSMEPMLLDRKEIILLENYYQCGNLAEPGDIIAYNYGGNKNPLVKIVKATDQDEVEIVDDKLKINGEILKNSAGQEYIFRTVEMKMLNLYIKDKYIPKNSFLIFGDNINDSTDSRKFGAVSANDFLGKFMNLTPNPSPN